MQKVIDWIDIEAPRAEVFETVVNIDHRMQLSPLWGLSLLLGVSANYPKPGSSYRVRVTDAPFGIAGGTSQAMQNAFAGIAQIISLKIGHTASNAEVQSATVTGNESSAEEEQLQKNVVEREQEYFVSDYEPPQKFSYYLDADCKTVITWRFQDTPRGTRINYEEVFCQENVGEEDFLPTVRNVIHEWLINIKRYSELRGSRGRLFVKWFLDRFFLKLRPDQRRTVLLILFLQVIAMVTFLIAAIGLGIAGMFF